MTRINTNVSSLTAQKSLARSNLQLQEALTRLSTGLRINVGKDDPAGLIASEVLRSDIVSTQKAVSNSQRANQMIATSDSALGQVSALLNDIRGLITEAANEGALSDEQIAANQLQIDSSLEAINRIAQTTTFQGRKLLDGSLDFLIDAKPATVRDLQIDQANLGTTGSIAVSATISAAATQATTTMAIADPAGLADDVVFELAGKDGAQVFNFEAGTSGDDVAAAINLVSDATGVEGTYAAGTLTLTSSAYGSNAFVSVSVIDQGALGTVADARDEGSDVVATVNGMAAYGDGNKLSVSTPTLSMSITVDDGSAVAVSFDITGGGALFQLGPDVVSNQQARIGISSVNTASLGGSEGRLYQLASGQDASLAEDPTTAAKIVDQVMTKLTSLRGRLGAFQKTTLDTNINALNDTLENLTDAESNIRDADFAAETAKLTRAQILVQSGMSVLAIANQRPQAVLALLR